LPQEPNRWSTEAIPVAEQFAFWNDVVWEAFVPVDARREGDGGFHGTVTATRIGPLGVARIASEAQTVHRTEAHVRRDEGDVFFLNLPLTARSRASQAGRVAELTGGDFTLVDSTRPFELGFGGPFDQLSFTIPRGVLDPLLADPAAATARRVRGDRGLGAVAGGALRAAAAASPGLDRAEGAALGRHLVGLVALALGDVRTAPPATTPELLLARAREQVDRSLADPDLAPADVAARLGVSVRYLHRLFSAEGPSFGRWVLARRLERCRDALADPARADVPIGRVAVDHGFADPSYFARAFRRRYGVSPREWRAAVARATPPSGRPAGTA